MRSLPVKSNSLRLIILGLLYIAFVLAMGFMLALSGLPATYHLTRTEVIASLKKVTVNFWPIQDSRSRKIESAQKSNTVSVSNQQAGIFQLEARIKALESQQSLLDQRLKVQNYLAAKKTDGWKVHTLDSLKIGILIPVDFKVGENPSFVWIEAPSTETHNLTTVTIKATKNSTHSSKFENEPEFKKLDNSFEPLTINGTDISFSSYIFSEGGSLTSEYGDCFGSVKATYYFTDYTDLRLELISGIVQDNCNADKEYQTKRSNPADIVKMRQMLETITRYEDFPVLE